MQRWRPNTYTQCNHNTLGLVQIMQSYTTRLPQYNIIYIYAVCCSGDLALYYTAMYKRKVNKYQARIGHRQVNQRQIWAKIQPSATVSDQ